MTPSPLLYSQCLLLFYNAHSQHAPLRFRWRWTGDWPARTNIPSWISEPQHINVPCSNSTSSTTVHWLTVGLPAAAAFATPLSLNRLSQCRNCDVLAFFGTCTRTRSSAYPRIHTEVHIHAHTSFTPARLPARLPRRRHARKHASTPARIHTCKHECTHARRLTTFILVLSLASCRQQSVPAADWRQQAPCHAQSECAGCASRGTSRSDVEAQPKSAYRGP